MAEILQFPRSQPARVTASTQQIFIDSEIYEVRTISIDDGAGWTQVIDASGRLILVLPAPLRAEVVEREVMTYRANQAQMFTEIYGGHLREEK